MVLFNYSARELTAKIVYYGPGLCGKTTNLQFIYSSLPESVKGKMLSLATKTDRTLFFDFLPLDLGQIAGMKTRIQLYTVPGQVFYNETRKLVLTGSDGLVFVADSQAHLLAANSESLKNLEDNLRFHGLQLKDLPLVLQYNKRDLPSLTSVEELNCAINKYNSPFYEAVATTGIGVQDTLRAITKLVLINLCKKFDFKRYEEMSEQQKARGSTLQPPGRARTTIRKDEEDGMAMAAESVQLKPEFRKAADVEDAKVPVGTKVSIKNSNEHYTGMNVYGKTDEISEHEEIPIHNESEISIYDDLEEIELVEEVTGTEQMEEKEGSFVSPAESAGASHEEPLGSMPEEAISIAVEEPIPAAEELSVASVQEEQKKEIHNEISEQEFELADTPVTPQPRPETEEKEIQIILGHAKDIVLPLTVGSGKDKINLNLIISVKFEEKKRE